MAITPTSATALTGALLTGTTAWGPITPAIGTQVVQIVIDRAALTLLTQPIRWTAELSFDGGATWPWGGGAGCPAGQISDVTLQVFTESSCTIVLAVAADSNTRIRGTITTLEPLTTTMTVRMT